MAVVQITSREFRNNQASAFELADKGAQVIIRRGKKRSYMLAPIYDDDLQLSAEAEERISKSRQEYANGEVVTCSTIDELHNFLETL